MKSSALEITLKEFMAIAEIPRPSHHEEKIGAYLVEWAQKRGLTVEQDAMVKRFDGKVKWMTASPARTGSARP